MALLKKDVEEIYFPDFEDYILLWKLEVLPKYQNRGYASELIDFAKSFNMPIKAIGRNDSKDFFYIMDLQMEAKNIEGHDVLLWKP